MASDPEQPYVQHICQRMHLASAVRYKGEERTYVPEEIISLVLKHLVTTAEQQLMGRRVTQVPHNNANCRPLSAMQNALSCSSVLLLSLMLRGSQLTASLGSVFVLLRRWRTTRTQSKTV